MREIYFRGLYDMSKAPSENHYPSPKKVGKANCSDLVGKYRFNKMIIEVSEVKPTCYMIIFRLNVKQKADSRVE